MTEREEKPDAVVRVNDFDITLYRRGRGLFIRVQKDEIEVGFFGIAGATGNQQEPIVTPASAPAASSEPETQGKETSLPIAPSPAATAEARKELSQPVKIVGIVAEIEGMGQTPLSGDPVFRFSVKTEQEEIKKIAAFREIGKALHGLTLSPDPNIKLIPGRPISMMAFDHTEKTDSYYPSLVNYLNLPPITNPKMQKRR